MAVRSRRPAPRAPRTQRPTSQQRTGAGQPRAGADGAAGLRVEWPCSLVLPPAPIQPAQLGGPSARPTRPSFTASGGWLLPGGEVDFV